MNKTLLLLTLGLITALGCSDGGGGGDGKPSNSPDELCGQVGDRSVECRVSPENERDQDVADCRSELRGATLEQQDFIVCIFQCWLEADSCVEFKRLVEQSEDCENFCK